MALIVEDGSGLTTAESYASVAAATTYLTERGREAAWIALAEAVQEEHLRNGTEYLDTEFSRVWRGTKNNSVQALPWPRTGVHDDDGYLLANDVLPVDLVRATIEAALRDATVTGGLQPDIEQVGRVKKESIEVGSLAISTEWVDGGSDRVFFRRVRRLVSRLIRSNDEVVRG